MKIGTPAAEVIETMPVEAGAELAEDGLWDEEPDEEEALIRLPASVREVWIPLGVAFVCYSTVLCLAVAAAMGCSNPQGGAVMLGMLVVGYLGVVLPFVAFMAKTMSRNLKVERSGMIVLQNAAIGAPPLVGIVIGMVVSSRPVAGPVCGALIGGSFLLLLMPCVWRCSAGKAAQAAVLIFTAFAAGAAGCILVALLLFSLVLEPMGVGPPWQAPEGEDGETMRSVAPAQTIPRGDAGM